MTSVEVVGLDLKIKELKWFWINNLNLVKLRTKSFRACVGKVSGDCSANTSEVCVASSINIGQNSIKTDQCLYSNTFDITLHKGTTETKAYAGATYEEVVEHFSIGKVGVLVNNTVGVVSPSSTLFLGKPSLITEAMFPTNGIDSVIRIGSVDVVINASVNVKGCGLKIKKAHPHCLNGTEALSKGLVSTVRIGTLYPVGNSLANCQGYSANICKGSTNTVACSEQQSFGQPQAFTLGKVVVDVKSYVDCIVEVQGMFWEFGVGMPTVEATAVFSFGRR